jgi:diguanylate cyclase (GGDEF)-like protein
MERWKMQATSLTSRLKRRLAVRGWAWWELPPLLRGYVAALIVVAVGVTFLAGAYTTWHVLDVWKFLLLACCGVTSAASTPRIAYTSGVGVTRDFSTIWALPTAILLPPVYAALIPIPLVAVIQLFVHRGVLYRRVFTCASISLSCVATSVAFRWFPASFAGGNVGHGLHAFTWTIAVAICEFIGGRVQHFLIVGAVKLSDRSVRIWRLEWNREAMQGLFVEIDLGVLITLAVGLSPALILIAAPTVLLVRRFLVHPILVAQSRVDSKTGLLNVSTWESEAETELSRAIRTRSPVALALVDIDHFKLVNDTYGHLVGDRVLKAVAEALTGQSRDYDRAGRFGGEEFVLLLAQTAERDACRIAQRIRGYVAAMAIPVDDRPDAPTLKVTISIGVTALARGQSYELTDLLAAADSAMYAAKQAGRNHVAFAPPLRDMGLDTALNAAADANSENDEIRDGASNGAGTPLGSNPLSSHRVVLVQAEQSAASLCPRR